MGPVWVSEERMADRARKGKVRQGGRHREGGRAGL